MPEDLEHAQGGQQVAHGPDCPCTRCVGFARRHGAYSEQEVRPLREAIFAALCEQAPARNEADDHARRELAGRLAQIEVARRWIDEKGLLDENGELWPIVRELPKWEGAALRYMRELAITTLSRGELGLDLARTAVAVSEVQELVRRMNGLIIEFVPSERAEEFRAAWDERITGQLGGGDGA